MQVWKLLLISAAAIVPLANPAARADESAALEEAPITAADRDHWSFRPLLRPAVPPVNAVDWPAGVIDRFILARQEAAGLTPLPPAGRATLIRRLYFDLLGLPPTPAEVDAFLADPSPHAYQRLVDRLLASPRFGERWAQHWLDLARFAETDGFEHDKLRKSAWRYRDWVVAALNADLPYDHFIGLQLAGDELLPDDEAARVATSFCLSGPDMPDINSQDERRHNLLNEMTSTVGAALLGLQLGCAACHDHKYDPISQGDFYRLRAVFSPAVAVKKNESVSMLGGGSDASPVSHLMIRGDWRRPGPVVPPAFPRIANPWDERLAAEPEGAPARGRRLALARWLARHDHPLTARVIVNRLWQHHFGEGLSRTPSDFGIVGDVPSHPQLLDWLATELIHREWSLKHIHRLIVTSAAYRQASRPGDTQWTAALREAAEASWRRGTESDPDNYWLARFPRRRLSGEAIRDALLSVAGRLDLRQGGPGVRPPLPEELVQTLLKNQWDVSPREADHYRRSIYVFARRNLRYPIFEAFDRPDANASCPRRSRSTTAPQSLLLLNSALTLDAARHLAGYALQHAEVRQARIALVFHRALCRQADGDELRMLGEFVERQRAALAAAGRPRSELVLPAGLPDEADLYEAAALVDVCLALVNTSEFIYVD